MSIIGPLLTPTYIRSPGNIYNYQVGIALKCTVMFILLFNGIKQISFKYMYYILVPFLMCTTLNARI